MGKYGNNIYVWNLMVGGADLKLHPTTDDNFKLLEIQKLSKQKKDPVYAMKQIGELIKEIIKRDYPPLNDEERKELDNYIGFNLSKLQIELLKQFGWATDESIEQFKEQALKEALDD
ncbi:hypothetical protein HYU06_05820 [Candidatus Woesearchaeota archaeon]|nr:hypothetical protein [Candidatus Woesearchaeota archaeon]